jgi:hypothetical protein
MHLVSILAYAGNQSTYMDQVHFAFSAQLLAFPTLIHQHCAFLPQAVLALNQRVIPPTFNCVAPNPIFDADAAMLYPVREGRQLPMDAEMYAGQRDVISWTWTVVL